MPNWRINKMKTINEVINRLNVTYATESLEVTTIDIKSDNKKEDGCINWLEVVITKNNNPIAWATVHVPNNKISLETECAASILTPHINGKVIEYISPTGVEMYNLLNHTIQQSLITA